MTDHDPLCPQPAYDQECPRCALIARVRADEREKMKANLSGVYAGIRASAEAEVRERIAQEIEAQADDWSDWDAIVKTEGDVLAIRDLVKDAIHDAARIARGDTPTRDQ